MIHQHPRISRDANAKKWRGLKIDIRLDQAKNASCTTAVACSVWLPRSARI